VCGLLFTELTKGEQELLAEIRQKKMQLLLEIQVCVCVRACVCDMSGLHAHSRCYASAVLAMALCLSFTSQEF